MTYEKRPLKLNFGLTLWRELADLRTHRRTVVELVEELRDESVRVRLRPRVQAITDALDELEAELQGLASSGRLR